MATNQEMLSTTYINVHKLHTEQIPDLPVAIWDQSYVNRDGKRISVKQELADCKTLALENKAKLDQILAKLNEGA